MSDIIQRVALSLWGEIGGDRETCLRLARVAIAAMREPTEAMLDAGFAFTGDPCWPDDVGKAWRAMIDEALKSD